MTLKLSMQTVPWSENSGHVKVLDAHLFEAVQNPFWDLDENDHLKLPWYTHD